MKKYFTYMIIVAITISSISAQVDYVEMIQPSKNSTKEYSLFFIDFWATFCTPCAYATIHVDNLQQQFPNSFFAATISEEQPDLIKKYLKKHPTRLAVYADFKSYTFNRYSVKTLPHGIVLNAKGKIVWQGNPADFSASELSRLLRSNKKKIHITSVFKHSEPSLDENYKPDYLPSQDFELVFKPKTSTNSFNINSINDYIHITGTVQSIIAHANQLLNSQVSITDDQNKTISIYLKKHLKPYLSQLVLNKLELKTETILIEEEALIYNISNPRFWNTNQINWNDNNLNFLIGDDLIEADNVTFKSFAYQVSKVLNMPFIIKGNYDENKLHDWQVYYQYFDLMQPSLQDVYGVKVIKDKASVSKLLVSSK